MSNVTPKRQRAGAVQDAFARFGSDRTALRVLECGSHLPLYVDEQRKSSANLESLPVWKPMDTQPLYRGYEPALIPLADHPVEPFRRNRKVTNLNQDLTPLQKKV
jgi:hypothetical protein